MTDFDFNTNQFQIKKDEFRELINEMESIEGYSISKTYFYSKLSEFYGYKFIFTIEKVENEDKENE